MEESISNNLEALSRKINEAAGSMGRQAKQDSMSRAADKARDIARGLESLDQRMRDQARQRQQGSKGSQNSQSSQGSQNSRGSRGSQSAQNGQQGQQDGAANNGQPNGGSTDGAYGGGAYRGDARNWGGWYGGYWDPNDVRQFRRDFREWAADAEALRRQLQQNGVNPRDLDDIIRDLYRFADYSVPRDRLLQRSPLRRPEWPGAAAGAGHRQDEEIRVLAPPQDGRGQRIAVPFRVGSGPGRVPDGYRGVLSLPRQKAVAALKYWRFRAAARQCCPKNSAMSACVIVHGTE